MAIKTNTEINGKKYYKVSLFLGYDETGRRKYKQFYGTGKKDAEDQRDEYKDLLKNSLLSDNPTLSKSLHDWLFEVIKPSGIKDSTFSRLYDNYKGVKDSDIGYVRVKDLTAIMIQKTFNKMAKEKSYNYVNNIRKLLTRHLKYLSGINMIIRNPIDGVILPLKEKQKFFKKVELNPFSEEEKTKLLCYMEAHQYNYFLILSLLFTLGAREGEILGLHESDISDDSLNISRSLRWTRVIGEDGKYTYEYQNETPKNSSSVRILYINENVKSILRKAEIQKKTNKLKLGPVFKDSPLLFTTESGQPINDTNFRKSVARALKRLSIPHRTVHSIRHTFITECFEKGIDELTVQEIVGHTKGSNVTREIYTHLRKETKKERMLEAFK